MNINQPYKPTGEYRHYTICRFCNSHQLYPVINLGYVPLAGGFLKSKKLFNHELFYPLEISFCKNCYLLQSVNVINKDTLFKDYFYHSSVSKTLTTHFESVADEMRSSFNKMTDPFVVEIGCNDATIIKSLRQKNIRALGVDPATNVVIPLIKKGIPIINDYFSTEIANKIAKEHGKADMIFSSNTLAHIEDMLDVVKGIKILLKPDGFLMFEVHYLGNLLYDMQYDMIYHEHQYYYSLLTLQKLFSQYEMEIFNVLPIKIHAGSMRYYVQHKKGARKVSKNVLGLVKKEKKLKLDKIETFRSLAKKIAKTKIDLIKSLNLIKKENKLIAGYGASGRGTIIMNYCSLDSNYLGYVIDDSTAKQGAYTPGTHLEIVSSDILKSKKRPDYVLLFAWSFLEELKQRNKKYLENGGKFIIPLPKVKILDY